MQRRKLSSENRSRHCSLQTSFTHLDAFLRRYFVTNLLVCLDLPQKQFLIKYAMLHKIEKGVQYIHGKMTECLQFLPQFCIITGGQIKKKKIGHENSHSDVCLFVTMFVYPFSLPPIWTFLLFELEGAFSKVFCYSVIEIFTDKLSKMPNSNIFT